MAWRCITGCMPGVGCRSTATVEARAQASTLQFATAAPKDKLRHVSMVLLQELDCWVSLPCNTCCVSVGLYAFRCQCCGQLAEATAARAKTSTPALIPERLQEIISGPRSLACQARHSLAARSVNIQSRIFAADLFLQLANYSRGSTLHQFL